uniref:BTB domain-containing protein n=1 Tax=Biomphalaria glabrata TaxID=6526 RepID=A0A2C9M7U3_BIOGL
MVIKREMAFGIVQGLGDIWKCQELQDFTVTLGDTQYGCHRLLLAACSIYFRGLFRSGMKETESNCVTVEDISSETFELILETLYTGHSVLTNDNVIDIWRAAHRLQIEFLVKECENFVIKTMSLENYIDYFKVGRLFNSNAVVDVAWMFMLKNFTSFSKEHFFLELPLSDVLRLVESQSLVAKSEDNVIKAIMKWIEFAPNSEGLPSSRVQEVAMEDSSCLRFQKERNDSKNVNISNENSFVGILTGSRSMDLFALMSRARTCLASHECLEMMLGHPLVTSDKQTRDLITQALLYQLQIGKRNGQWPSSAIHRNSSFYENVAIAAELLPDRTLIKVFSFTRNKWFSTKIKSFPGTEVFLLAAVDKSLYSLCVTLKSHWDNEDEPYRLSLFELTHNSWSEKQFHLRIPPLCRYFFTAVNDYIYLLNSDLRTIWRLDPKSTLSVQLANIPDDQPISHVTTYEHLILVFYPVSVEGEAETAVDYYDTSKNTWARFNNLEGPANGMTSFKDDQSTYLLQSTGDVWKLIKTPSNQLDFEHVIKLWSCDWSFLCGAVTYMDELYIYGVKCGALRDDPTLRKSLPGVFSNIIYIESESISGSMFLPFVVNRKLLD